MKTDAQLKLDVMSELDWEPSVDATNVGVAVKDSVVTLTGHLDSFHQKLAIEHAVQRVQGVRAIAIELDVQPAAHHRPSDAELATAAEAAFEWHSEIPVERIQLQVEKGWITLRGEVDWDFERQAALDALRGLPGVVGIHDMVTLTPRVVPADVHDRIRDALARCADQQARRIEVQIDGATATLRGTVHSWAERAEAQAAVWAAPGISQVVNEIQVSG